ncbi:MAG: hypothetical protein ACLUUO_18490 [Sellimonas intestinalis]
MILKGRSLRLFRRWPKEKRFERRDENADYETVICESPDDLEYDLRRDFDDDTDRAVTGGWRDG